ncbi:MAG: protein phosphatase 2C domain-containing protein [Coprobacillus sp.]|nr:protein phosphatase 2C domain-containing protein [Coprobacillus sp.]
MSKEKGLHGDFAFKSDKGIVRSSNEDRCIALMSSYDDVLLAVADGMGGYNKGDLAAQMTIDYLKEAFLARKRFYTANGMHHWLKKNIKKINTLVYEKSISGPDYSGMGTTLTCVVVMKNKAIYAQIGDSRAYAYTSDTLEQVTEDQSLVEYYYRTGQISEEEKITHQNKNVLTNALGTFPSLSLAISTKPYHGEGIFLCSDGLYNNLGINDIKNILQCNEGLSIKASMLISSANSNNSNDNLSVVLWESK